MAAARPGINRYRSLHASGLALARAAPLARFGLFAVGVSVFLDQVRPLVSDAQFTWGERRVMGVVAVITLGGFGMAGWAAGQLLRASGELVEVFIDGAEAARETSRLIETHLVPSLNRAATALERLAAAPDADDLRARLDAALAEDDPERVIACRDALTQHLRGEPLRELDRRVVRWLADVIQRRARAGPVTPALAALAARVADSFGDTAEGSALLAAVPGLRRRAGLCPRCARPHRGPAACPDCTPGGSP